MPLLPDREPPATEALPAHTALVAIDGTIGPAPDLALFTIALTVGPGDSVHVVGANGAGKSSLLNTIAGLLPILDGRVTVAGRDADGERARLHLGHVPDPPALYDELSPREHLELMRRLWGSRRHTIDTEAAIESFGLASFCDQYGFTLSLGQRKRLAIALSMLHRPEVLVLDEPFNGLDDEGIDIVRSQLTAHLSSGGAALVSSHQPAPLEGITTRTVAVPPHESTESPEPV